MPSRVSFAWIWKRRARVPGVVAVLSEADLAADGIGELPCVTVIDAVEPIIVPPRPALARGVVRHVGDPVVCIVAESPEAAIGGRRGGGYRL